MPRFAALHIILLLMLTLWGVRHSPAQQLSGKREKTLAITSDTTRIDSLTIIPESLTLHDPPAEPHSYKVDTLKGLFIVTDTGSFFQDSDTIRIKLDYRVLSYPFNKNWPSLYQREKDELLIEEVDDPTRYREQEDFFDFGEMDKSGAITRGFTVGNQQDLALTSNLDLQLNGDLTNDLRIRAAITDNKIPVQPEGNTRQIQEFDKVFIEIRQRENTLTAGDFEVRRSGDGFLRYGQKVQGIKAETGFSLSRKKDRKMQASSALALSKAKYARSRLEGIEGNQGPYKLEGNNNERFIIIIAGSETVFLDGKLLQRGESRDYVINYNTGEIRFTPQHMITKDSRIIVEFEYADRNYARSLFTANTRYQSKNLRLDVSYFNKSDLKNQPFDMELDDTTRSILANAGDDPREAVSSGIDSVDFTTDKILYRMTDSLGYDSVLVYSTDPSTACYHVKFSRIGKNQGNYVPAETDANGRVYKWVEPKGGVPQGEFAPVRRIIPPERKQLVEMSAVYDISKKTKSGMNLSASNHDQNLFSELDEEDNKGIASKIWLQHKERPGKNADSSKLEWVSRGEFRFVHQHFSPVNRFRSSEFERDWNLKDRLERDEIKTKITTGISHQQRGKLNVSHEYLQHGKGIQRNRYSVDGNFNKKGYFLYIEGSLLQGRQSSLESRFLRHRIKGGKQFRYFTVSLDEDYEHNSFRLASDSLASNSFAHHTLGTEVAMPDTGSFHASLRFEQRKDRLPVAGILTETSVANQASASINWKPSKHQQLKLRTGMRKLETKDTLSAQPTENTLNTRLDYSANFAGGAITAQTFYQSGSGMEVKKDFTYMEVSPGQGVYEWIDYNNNGIKEQDEFEVAQFQDKADYIRVFIPADEYIRVYNNQFSGTLDLTPSRLWNDNESKLAQGLAKFSNRFSSRITQKNQLDDFLKAYNPFYRGGKGSDLLTLDEQLHNVLHFQRNNSRFGANWSYKKTKSKSLMANGWEKQQKKENILNLRWNITTEWSFFSQTSLGNKRRDSEYFKNRAYNIDFHSLEPSLSFQPSVNLRIKGVFSLTHKANDSPKQEKADIYEYRIEVRRAALDKGNMQLRGSFLNIKFPAANVNNLEYEMLEGFKDGKNFRWELSYQRRLLEYLQLNLQYEGRKTPAANIVHVGRIQLRAHF